MASGDGTSDGLGREQHTRMKSLGKATLEENKTSTALESLSRPEKNQSPKILSTQNVAQDLTLSKGKQAVQDSKYGHDSIDQNKQSSTSWPIGSFQGFPSSDEECIIALGPSSSLKTRLIQALQETDSQIDGPDLAQLNLEGVAASVAPAGATVVEPNGGALVVLNDVGCAEPFVGPTVVLHVVAPVAPAQSNVALVVAPFGEVPPNVAPPAPAIVALNIAPRVVAPVQPDVATHAQRNGAPPARAQPIAALIVAPPAVVVLDVNHGLNHSQLKPLQICEIGSQGHFWPKFP